MNGIKDITIIMPTRNNISFLQLALQSIRKRNEWFECPIIVYADDCNNETLKFLQQNKNKYNFSYHTSETRKGITLTVDELISHVTTDIVFYIHDDMFIADKALENMLKHLKPKHIVTATRIEPPLHNSEMCKVLEDFGRFAEDFQEERFEKTTQLMIKSNTSRITHGIFAPFMFFKNEWIGHDKLFIPQSNEDSDLFYRMLQSGFEFIQSWEAYVYHFTCRGSRYRGKELIDSDEWKKSQKKNLKNFIRKWGSTPLYDEWKYPIIIPRKNKSANILACNKDIHYVYNFLENIEPYFDDIVFVFDSKEKNLEFENEINRYCNDIKNNGPTNFDKNKIKIYYHLLNENFAAQTNYAVSKCANRWTMKIDLDEFFPEQFLNNLNVLIYHAELQGSTVIGFPRINTLNGVVVNDVPRTEWTEEKLKFMQKPGPNERIDIKNPDYQFRLHTRNVQWIGSVHEVPKPVAENNQKLVMITKIPFYHNKTVTQQDSQNKFYEQIHKKTIKKLMYDSVIFTTEGITEHARQEIKELNKRGYEIQLTDLYRYNEYIPDCEWYRELYKPFDITRKDYAVVCNQPPERWGKSINFNNFIGYLAFEGQPPQNWVQSMNDKRVKEIWTPSQYCVSQFKSAGVTTPLYVIPHGIDENIWKPLLEIKKNDKFTFLWAGTLQNLRKGADILIKAFSEQFKGNNNVQLIMKVNNIYNPGFDADSFIQRYIVPDGNCNIAYIDSDMTEPEFVTLMNECHVFVSCHRSEGFGMIGLQALACGIPFIATKATGNMEYCTEQNTHFIDVELKERWAPFVYPYLDAKWSEPDLESLKKQMQFVFDNYQECSKKALVNSEQVRKDWSWKHTVDKIEERLKQL